MAAIDKTVLIEVSFATGDVVLKKSIPSFCVNPLAQSLALYLSIVPSAFLLILNTNLFPTIFALAGLSTSSQVFSFFNESSSFLIASSQSGQSSRFLHSLTVFGFVTSIENAPVFLFLSFDILSLLRKFGGLLFSFSIVGGGAKIFAG